MINSFVFLHQRRIERIREKLRMMKMEHAIGGLQGRRQVITCSDVARSRRSRIEREESKIPYMAAFKVFGAKNVHSKINSTEFEMGLSKIQGDFNFSRKTVLEIFGESVLALTYI